MAGIEERAVAAPRLNIGDEPYLEAASNGRLLVKRCRACGEHHHYPRPVCPFCFSDDTEWTEAQGTGTIYSFSVTRSKPPYVIAYVTLDEGPSMMTNIVDCDIERVGIGQRVRVVVVPTDGGPAVPMFRPTVHAR